MKKYEQETVTVTRTKFMGKTCDICGNANKEENDDWSIGSYDVEEVTIQHRSGSAYPEGGSGEEFHPDICPKCFRTKIIPFLRELGVKTPYEDYDY